jgi:hypothetical protein
LPAIGSACSKWRLPADSNPSSRNESETRAEGIDQWVSLLRSLGALHDLSAKANWSSKARTLISFPTICVIYYYLQAPAHWGLPVPDYVVYGLEGVSMAINLVSIGVYTARFWPALRTELQPTQARNEGQTGEPRQ